MDENNKTKSNTSENKWQFWIARGGLKAPTEGRFSITTRKNVKKMSI